MPIRINCPACKTPNSVADDKRGRKVRCAKCKEPFSVPEAKAPKKRPEEDAVQDGRKIKAASPRKRDADDDDEDRPAKKKKTEPAKKGSGMMLAVGGAAAVLLCCLLGVGGIGAYFLFGAKPEGDAPKMAKAGTKNVEEKKEIAEKKDIVEKKDNVGEPKKDPIVEPDVGKPLPAQLPSELVAKVKQATVYLHVTMPSGVTAEGSGFFAMERGIIVTNAHVLGMLLESSRAPKQVDVVQDSGLPTETKMIGQVLGVDRVSDLAVIRVPDNGKLPTPLTLSTEAPTELQKIYIFGFPFGERLGKNITISEQAITSLRPDKSGGLDQIQVNGGMNPGNSGGPVVSTRGNLVGVSVSIITGAQISFAVPAEKVRRVMEGRIADHVHGDAFMQQGRPHLPVRLTCLDPLNKIRDMRVEVWTAPPGAGRPRTNQKPAALPGDGPRQEHAVKYANGAGALDVPLPPLPAGHVYWVQPVLTSAVGTHWGAAQPTGADFAVLERKPANLVVSLDKHKERTAKVDSRFTIIQTFGKKETKVIEHTTMELLEMVQEPVMKDGKTTANIKTAVGPVTVRVDVNGKNIKFGRDELDALAISRGMAPTFVIDDTNATAGYLKIGMSPKHPKILLKPLVEEFNGMINNPFEATQFKMPNRLVQPQEMFPSLSTMMMRIGNAAPPPKGKQPPQRATIYDLKLNCTYEGVRTRNDREEAVLTVVGTLETRNKVPARTLGNITGKIGFDTAGGFVSSAKIKIFAESEDTIPGLGTFRDSVSQDIDLDRTAGNNLKGVVVAGKDPPPPKDPLPTKEVKVPVVGGAVANPPPNEFFQGDVTLRHLAFAKPGVIVDDIVWAKNGKSFFMLFDNGLLQRINVASGQTEQFLDIGAKCTALALSGPGLLVAVNGADQLWVVDPDKLGNVTKKIAVPGINRVSSGVDASIVWAGFPNPSGRGIALKAVDAAQGTVLKMHAKFEIWVFAASPDGKYVCVANDDGLSRYRIERDDLIREDVSYRIGGNNTRRICFSPDSKFVAMPSGGGNSGGLKDHPALKNYATYIYPIDDLKRPVAGFAGGAFPRAVGIDPKSNFILAQNQGKPLMLYSFATDTKIADYDFKPLQRAVTAEFAVSPFGSEAIARTEKHGIVHIKINKAGPPIGKIGLDRKPARDPIARLDGGAEEGRNPGLDAFFRDWRFALPMMGGLARPAAISSESVFDR